VGLAYLLLFIAGAHYAYLNKWGTQILFWITFGGLGIWWLIDIFRLANMVHDFNDPIFDEIEWLENQDRYRRDDFTDLERRQWEREQNRERQRRGRSGNFLDDGW
jgi:TM2 domain-containing membrane protein YozV